MSEETKPTDTSEPPPAVKNYRAEMRPWVREMGLLVIREHWQEQIAIARAELLAQRVAEQLGALPGDACDDDRMRAQEVNPEDVARIEEEAKRIAQERLTPILEEAKEKARKEAQRTLEEARRQRAAKRARMEGGINGIGSQSDRARRIAKQRSEEQAAYRAGQAVGKALILLFVAGLLALIFYFGFSHR